MSHDALAAQLHALREQVAGITDTLIAAVDGLLIVADAADTVDIESVSALAAADLGLARRTATAIGQGTFRQTVVYNSGGCMAVYAIGRSALMVVLGDEGLDIGLLQLESQPVIECIGSILAAS
ncbi:roadblock/LC7 domain-containing protein [Kutzneria viridogrisea]|uniref:Roadblock/LAMTOR2 domain-containing protein n=2 Tax=Kutzneria TaxID=43356 RepID=W5VXK1_9PSEU|nr:roadblock/LC7 domain-containing protein [Kutzneria albida]AHH93573.1 hypothetical protein KALB_196 [Kutzneria albida DSM 43870]MBA8929042.1 hypothetical protein [Kutzneria viridogrisea]